MTPHDLNIVIYLQRKGKQMILTKMIKTKIKTNLIKTQFLLFRFLNPFAKQYEIVVPTIDYHTFK